MKQGHSDKDNVDKFTWKLGQHGAHWTRIGFILIVGKRVLNIEFVCSCLNPRLIDTTQDKAT